MSRSVYIMIRWLITVFGSAFISFACAGPGFVEELVVENPTDYPMDVDVSAGADDGWLSLGRVHAHEESVEREVADQGERWTFRFRYLGEPVGRLVVDRTDLESADWRVRIPPSVAGSAARINADRYTDPGVTARDSSSDDRQGD